MQLRSLDSVEEAGCKDEEEAFWVLSAMIEKILPEDFFSPSLLSSRACPLVLMDYVQELLPKLYSHLIDLGIDLGSNRVSMK